MQYRIYLNAHGTRSDYGKVLAKRCIMADRLFFLFFSCHFRTFFLCKFDNFEVIRIRFIESLCLNLLILNIFLHEKVISFNCGEVRNIYPLDPVLAKKFSYSYFVGWEIRNPFDLKVFSSFSFVCILAQEWLF